MNQNSLQESRIRATVICALALIIGSVFVSVEAEAFQIRHTVEFTQSELRFSEYMNYDFIRLPSGYYLTDPGKPALPVRSVRIALPDGVEVQSVYVESSMRQRLPGTFDIFPTQSPLKTNQTEDELDFVEPDPTIYESDHLYPSSTAQFVGQSDLAGCGIATVDLCPFEYAPLSGELTFLTSITLVLECDEGYVCGDYLPDRVSDASLRVYRTMLEEMVINPFEAKPITSPFASMKSSTLPPGDPFDHVIITNPSEASYWEPLAEWHTKKGVRDTVITTTYIYGNYSGADNQEKIRNFVIDAHDNWGTLYFLIGGEHYDVPFKFRSYQSESIPSDQYYADYDDDWDMEVFVGRVTGDNATQIARFIEKLLKYETDPPLDNYPLDVTLLGMDLTTAFDPPYYTLTAGEEMKEYIDTEYVPSRFDVTEIYDSYSQNHRQEFLNALNDGQNLINHNDHCYHSVMGTGDRNHGWAIYSYDVDNLVNTGKMSVIFSLGCHPNEMDYNDCIAEHFVIYNDLKAGVAFTGNTRSGWFSVGDPFSLSAHIDYMWWEGLFDFNMYRLGNTLAYSKNNSPYSDSYWKYCQWTLNLLGEPEMPIWTDTPADLQVTHQTILPVLPCDFTVHVEEPGVGNIYDAYVCVYKEGEIYMTGYTDAGGDITFSVTPGVPGEMFVTVTKQDYIPYQGTTEFTDQNIAPTCVTPGDTTVLLCDVGEVCIPIGCYDIDGNLASGPTLVDGPGVIDGGYWCYVASGPETVTLTVMCEDSAGAVCESVFDVKVKINSPPSCAPPADTTIIQCSAQQVYLFIGTSDPDFNIAQCEVVSGPGSIQFGNWVYMPQGGDETVDVTVRCTDDCGEYCETSFQVDLLVNQPPVCGGPNDTTILQCEIAPVSLPVEAYDPEGQDLEYNMIMGPGEIVDGNWEYTPSGDELVQVVVRFFDPCGTICNNSFLVTFDINDPPMCTGSFDTTIVQCEAAEVSLPLPVFDPNANLTEVTLIEGPGALVEGNWVYTPTGKDTVDVTVRCIDACGEQCDDTFRATFDVNAAPVCETPRDTTFTMRDPELISVPIEVTDIDDNLVGCEVTEGPGEIVGDNWVFMPSKSDTANVTITCSDDCDVTCETGFQVVVMLYECGDADGNSALDIDDVVYLIGYIFSGGQAPVPVEAGDADCTGGVDIDDVVYMIAYIFSGGPQPCAECP